MPIVRVQSVPHMHRDWRAPAAAWQWEITNHAAPASPQSGNPRVGPQLPRHIVTAGPEDDAGGAAGLELGETFAQLLARAGEGRLFGGGYVDERVMAVRNVEVVTAV